METIGVLVASYGSREAAVVDALKRSTDYNVDLYIADKQKNPFNFERAKEHAIIPDLDPQKICDFAKKHSEKISFAFIGPENPIIGGARDLIEKETGIPVVCPTKEFAIEDSKLNQRLLLEKCCPETNPRFKVFKKEDYKGESELKKDLQSWLSELDNQVAVKPDRPGYGKGVGVWGDHFNSFDELFRHFLSIYEKDAVIVEEKVYGEESSLQCLCDGRSIFQLPDVRDYKRAFVDDAGPNTGGMGAYKDAKDYLPFMTEKDREKELDISTKIFKHLKGGRENDGIRGIALYLAFIHDKTGPRILEINTRGGDPETMNVVPLIKDDFVDLCFDMIDGSMKRVHLEKKASVVTYKVPPTYGGYDERFPEKVIKAEAGTPADLSAAYALQKKYGDALRIYPGSMKIGDDGKTYALSSRTVACVGIADTIEESRDISREAIAAVKGAALWSRDDVASKKHLEKSRENMKKLRP